METQTVEKVKPDSLNLSAKTVVGSGNDITHWNDSPVFMTGFFYQSFGSALRRNEEIMQQYATQMEAARKGIVTEQLKKVAEKERMTVEELMPLVAEGKVVICANKNHTQRRGLR